MPIREAARKLDEQCRAWREQFTTVNNHPVRDALGQLSGKWNIFVIVALAQRTMRFGELKRAIPEISQRVLTQTLRDLEMDGLISRKVFPTKPPSVEYSLTTLGESFLTPLWEVFNWANDNHTKILKARKRFIDAGK